MTKLQTSLKSGVLALILCVASVLFIAPGAAWASLDWDDVVGVFSATEQVRLDIGTRAMKENVPASHNSWATRLVIKRLDGPNSGPVEPEHIVGIFSENGQYRLDIGTRAMKENVPASHDSWATRLRIVPLDELALGPITYNTVVGVFAENDPVRLDIGTRAVKEAVPASHESWATQLQILSLE